MLRALPVLPVVLLAGCGIAPAQFHPGLAAEVGDQTITTRHLDQVADDYCKAVEKVSKGQEPTSDPQTPMRYLTNQFATDLVSRAAAEQLAEQYDVTPTSDYKTALVQLETQISNLSDSEKTAVREVIGARTYTQNVLTQIGGLSLAKQGKTDANNDDKLAEGQKLLAAWVADHKVVVNPKYAVQFGSSGQVDTDLSYPLASQAKAGLSAQPDTDYSTKLPDNLVCLD